MTATEFRAEHPNAFIFAFMRNPFSRLVSAYSYLNMPWAHIADIEDRKKYIDAYTDFRDFVIRGIGGGDALVQRHCRPQVLWISDGAGNIVTDFLGRFETLQEDFDKVCGKVGWDVTLLKPFNVSEHKPYQEYYDTETESIVRKVYAKDFEVG